MSSGFAALGSGIAAGEWLALTQAPATRHLRRGFLCESPTRGKSTGRYRQGFLSSPPEQ